MMEDRAFVADDAVDMCGDDFVTPARKAAGAVWRESGSILLGMPQLCLNGLSETWLLKELGHRHWMMLARLAGQDAPNFVDERSAPVYAAFCALSIRDADLGAVRENERLTISSQMERVSRTQMLSRHRLAISHRAIGEVEMVSVFVRRGAGGGNHCVARFEPLGLPPSPHAKPGAANLASRAAKIRAGRTFSHMGFVLDGKSPCATMSIDPCPSQDFNGAGFLYFSSFVAFVDRFEWMFDRDNAGPAATRRRDVFFFGNLDPGEEAVLRLMEKRSGPEGFAHHCQMERSGEGGLLARIFTYRRAGSSVN